jgi:hypothetical protein
MTQVHVVDATATKETAYFRLKRAVETVLPFFFHWLEISPDRRRRPLKRPQQGKFGYLPITGGVYQSWARSAIILIIVTI